MRHSNMMRSRLGPLLAMAFVLATGCSAGEPAATEAEYARVEISTPSGRLLDCPDELVASSVFDLVEEEGGEGTSQDAANRYEPFLVNDGSIEQAPGSSTLFLLADEQGNRLAWIETTTAAHGWFVSGAEECGSIFGHPPPAPGGPCVDGPNGVTGDTGLHVSASGTEVLAAFSFLEAGYCPGIGGDGPVLNADGFLLTLDETLLTLEPGEQLTIRGPGYFTAQLNTNWEIADAQTDPNGGQIWTLQAPAEPGSYHVDLRLEWAEGKAHHAVLANVGGGNS